MKVRIGFVTNSSSSSFLIVGVGDDELIAQLLNAEKIEEVIHDYGVHEGRVVNFYGDSNEEYSYYAGIPIEKLMEEMTLPQMKKYFQEMVEKKYGIKIPEKKIILAYGETNG